jgi:hypothetical protein
MRQTLLILCSLALASAANAGSPYSAKTGISAAADSAAVGGTNPAAMTRFDAGNMRVEALISAPLAVAAAGDHDAGTTHDESHQFHANTIGLFIGVTDEGREEAAALGIEYERRINDSFGVGVLAEYASGDLDFWVFAVPFGYHNGPWKLYAAPGVEDGDAGSEFLVRVGAEYAFEIGEFEIAPQFNLDFVDGEEVWVAGLLIAKGF